MLALSRVFLCTVLPTLAPSSSHLAGWLEPPLAVDMESSEKLYTCRAGWCFLLKITLYAESVSVVLQVVTVRCKPFVAHQGEYISIYKMKRKQHKLLVKTGKTVSTGFFLDGTTTWPDEMLLTQQRKFTLHTSSACAAHLMIEYGLLLIVIVLL